MIELTPGQAELLDKEVRWFRKWENKEFDGLNSHPQWFAYSGAAGCGKTTVAKEFINFIGLQPNEYIGCAYTGKAVLQMQKNGLNAKTIHSLIYDPVFTRVKDKVTGKMKETIEFILKDSLDAGIRLIIVDEAPMVNDEMVSEILSFKLPVIFMGDMNQLPPVFGTSTIMANPDHVLTQIMRQKEDDPIVQLSQMVLKDIPLLHGQYGKSSVVREFQVDKKALTDYDQILCVTNKLRGDINEFIREDILERTSREPRLFDKVICRQNSWDVVVNGYPLTNGTQGIITDIHRDRLSQGYYRIDFHPDYFEDGVDFEDLAVDAKYIRLPWDAQKNYPRSHFEKFEYAYAITVHLSQGSEYDRVLFIDSWFHDADLTKRARYTAITRAKKSITIVSGSSCLLMR